MNFRINRRKWRLLAIDTAIFLSVYVANALVASITRDVSLPMYLYAGLVMYFFMFGGRYCAGIYSSVWRYASVGSYLTMVLADGIGGALGILVNFLVPAFRIGVWQCATFAAMCNIVTLTSRFFYQYLYRARHGASHGQNQKIGVAIVGAGRVGALLAEELQCNPASHYAPVCFIDKDADKNGNRVCGLTVYKPDDHIIEKIRSLPVQEIFIAIPTLDGAAADHLRRLYMATGCKVKIYDFPFSEDGDPSRRVIREFRIEDLLFRSSLKVAGERTRAFYEDKVVLVTGGGGSIGSELCRQIAASHPRRLIIFDIYENNAYDIQQELLRRNDGLDLCVEIGSVRDRARLEAVFSHYRPQIVFHAAAHKHVPLMEHSNCEAIKNNCFGTYNTADMAEKYGVEKFILVSTDKAVNPTNIMGASKRMCEMVIQCRRDSATVFAAVRFGNVLGSNGSVIPLFRRQIAAGGPVTLTDKRIIRYFMSIPEAAGLVMTAGAMAKDGELFVLNMGKPVKILDLAENMIELSGLVPYKDIDIVETGLRPGEKLYEELLIKTEFLTKTDNDLIFVERDTPLTREEVEEKLDLLRAAVTEAEGEIGAASIVAAMKSVVPTFHDPEEVNCRAEQAEEMKLCASAAASVN